MGRFSARTRRKIWPRFKTGINAKAVVQIRVARLFLVQHTKNGKYIPNDHRIERIASKYTEWPQNIPNGHKMYQHFPLQDPPKYTKIGIFGFKNIPSGKPGANQCANLALPLDLYLQKF
jgi:hypothetical protein